MLFLGILLKNQFFYKINLWFFHNVIITGLTNQRLYVTQLPGLFINSQISQLVSI